MAGLTWSSVIYLVIIEVLCIIDSDYEAHGDNFTDVLNHGKCLAVMRIQHSQYSKKKKKTMQLKSNPHSGKM